jgi:hypothetical protein
MRVFWSGNDLFGRCQGRSDACFGCVVGIADAMAWHGRSTVYRAMGQTDQAGADLARAKQLNPRIETPSSTFAWPWQRTK